MQQKCLALDELVLDGRAFPSDEGCVLPFREYYELDDAVRELIELPTAARLSCSVRTRSIAADRGFQVVAEVTDPSEGRLEGFVSRVDGTYVLSPTEVLIAPRPIFELLRILDEGVPKGIADPLRARLTFQERVKRKAQAAGASLEGFMASESYVLPEDGRLTVGIEKISDEELRVRPEISAIDDMDPAPLREINRKLDESGAASNVLSGVTGDGGRIRAILDDAAADSVKQVRELREIRGADVPRFLDNPEAYLPEGLDLSDFSDRVTGIGIQRVSVRPSITLHRREGGVIDYETQVSSQDVGFGGGTGFDRGEPITSADLPTLIEAAKEKNEDYVYFKGKWVHVNVASLEAFQKAVQQAEKRFAERRLNQKDVTGFLEIFTNIEELEYDKFSQQLIREFLETHRDEGPKYPLPRILQGELLEHQKRGYLWLRFLEEQRWGGLLADDMGLGKTLQAISLLASLKEQHVLSPSLVVVPKTVLTNWEREIRRFCPDLSLHFHHGSTRVRTLDGIKDVAEHVDVIVTTYDVMRRDQVALGRIDWMAIILDEAQNIKNPNTGVATASKAFKSERTRLALTGTPVENGLSELWSIFDFVQPGHLGSYREFRDSYERPIQVDGSADAAEELRERIADLYLRRLKEDELPDLPTKKVVRERLPFGQEQRQLYVTLIEKARRAGRGEVLGVLHSLIQVCSHPSLVKRDIALPDAEVLIGASPKLAWTMRLLERVRDVGERVLIFTEYRAMQDLLVHAIHERFGVWVGRINGDVLTGERQRLVDELNGKSDFDALILSPTAGGVGLNITGANHVIHYTRLWNPAKEAQATDRAYRIGQTRDVTVYHPIVEDADFETIEVRIDKLLTAKAGLARDIITPSSGLQVTPAELEGLLGEAC